MLCLHNLMMAQDKVVLPIIHDSIDKKMIPPPEAPSPPSAPTPFRIREIYITGNKKTKFFTIERELPFKRGDRVLLADLVDKFEIGRQQIMNTTLFHEVVVAAKSFDGYDIDVMVEVKERWYIFPIPYFKLVDRNLNQWWVEQNRSLERVNYGLKFTYNNFSGRKDKLRLWLINGYNRQVQMRYEQPYADRSLKHGYNIGISYLSNREVNFATINDKQAFVREDGFAREQFNINLEYVYRPALRTRHVFRLNYTNEKVADTVVKLNQDYFQGALQQIRMPELSYTLDYQFVDYIPYPQDGFMGQFTLAKQGMGSPDINVWSLSGRAVYSQKISPKSSYTLQLNGTLRFPFNQPYFSQRLLGYGDNYLRGLEYYVIDGVAGGMLRTTLRREIFNFSVRNPVRSSIQKVPFRIFAKTYADLGYVYNPNPGENKLPNRMLYTAGVGLDIVTIYDFVLRIEFSLNQLGERGFFLHNNNDF